MQINPDPNYPTREFFQAEIVNTKVIDSKEYPGYNSNNDKSLNTNFEVKITNGEYKNKKLEVYSDGLEYEIGDRVYIEKNTLQGQEPFFILQEKIRIPEIFFSVILFSLVVIILFGKKGFKSLLSLMSSFIIIIFILIPLTLKGYNPILIASGISFLLLSSMMLITNGRNQITYAAILGCSISIFITIILTFVTVELTSITGKVDESWSYFNNYLNLNLNFSLIVIASMIIGVIGAVDDGAITQASVVNQLKSTNPNLTNLEYYKRAMEVGRDHAGAMVNTLVLAYVASSIPLLMLVYTSTIPLYILINQEIIATEIFRMTIGSIGLLLAIPITTLIAVYLFEKSDKSLHPHSHAHHH